MEAKKTKEQDSDRWVYQNMKIVKRFNLLT